MCRKFGRVSSFVLIYSWKFYLQQFCVLSASGWNGCRFSKSVEVMTNDTIGCRKTHAAAWPTRHGPCVNLPPPPAPHFYTLVPLQRNRGEDLPALKLLMPLGKPSQLHWQLRGLSKPRDAMRAGHPSERIARGKGSYAGKHPPLGGDTPVIQRLCPCASVSVGTRMRLHFACSLKDGLSEWLQG